MASLKQATGFITKVLRGDDPLLVLQNKEQWDKQFERGSWDRLVHEQPNTEYVAARVLEACKTGVITRVLDVGCGNGGLTRLLAPHKEKLSYVGVDVSEVAVAQATTELPEGVFKACDAAQPPVDLGVFDIVVFNEVFFYLNPAQVLPRYRAHVANESSLVVVSIVRSWRSLFLWRRIRKHLTLHTNVAITARVGTKHVWDIAVGTFKK